MQGDEARLLLGFPPNSRPTTSQVKEAYRRKVWESHPDLFPGHDKSHAESKFKMISEAYNTCLELAHSSGFSQVIHSKTWREKCTYSLGFPITSCNWGKSTGVYRLRGWWLFKVSFYNSMAMTQLDDMHLPVLIYRARGEGWGPASYARVVKTGVPRSQGGRNHGLIRVPFLFIILGTVTLGGINAARAYKKQKEAYPSHNPFLP